MSAHRKPLPCLASADDGATVPYEVVRGMAADKHAHAKLKLAMELARQSACGEDGPDALFVYFIRGMATGLIKIGRAKCVLRRLCDLQVSSPDVLLVEWLYYAPFDEELRLHTRFRQARSHGEWFHPVPGLVQFIERRRPPKDRWLRRDAA